MKSFRQGVLVVATVSVLSITSVFAQSLITVDENGNGNINGTPLGWTVGADPGPGGLSSVLIYSLPFAGLQGDVGLFDADVGATLDYIRFNGDGTLIFYSDNVDGFDALADTPSPPFSFYSNLVQINEVGTEPNNGAFYTPVPTQPGWNPSDPTYHFISDNVPEPGTLLAFVSGFAGLAGTLKRRILSQRPIETERFVQEGRNDPS